MITSTEDLRIANVSEVSTPAALHGEIPLTAEAAQCVRDTRAQVHDILNGRDDRKIGRAHV